jgi:hypothetical protein
MSRRMVVRLASSSKPPFGFGQQDTPAIAGARLTGTQSAERG